MWLTPHRNFMAGDLVLVKEKGCPRHDWRLALIDAVHPNEQDGLVRRVTLKLPKGQKLVRVHYDVLEKNQIHRQFPR